MVLEERSFKDEFSELVPGFSGIGSLISLDLEILVVFLGIAVRGMFMCTCVRVLLAEA